MRLITALRYRQLYNLSCLILLRYENLSSERFFYAENLLTTSGMFIIVVHANVILFVHTN